MSVDPIRSGGRRVLVLRVFAGCLLIAGLVGVSGVLSGSFDRTHVNIAVTSLAFGVFASTAALSGAAVPGSEWWRIPLARIGVAVSVGAFVIGVVLLWWDPLAPSDLADFLARVFGICVIAALWCAHAGAIAVSAREDDPRGVRLAGSISLAALGVDAAAGIAALAAIVELEGDGIARVLTALLIVAIVSALLVPVLRRLHEVAPAIEAAPAVRAAPSGRVPESKVPAEIAPDGRGDLSPAATVVNTWRRASAGARVALIAWSIAPVCAGFYVANAWRAGDAVSEQPAVVTRTVTTPPEPTASAPRTSSRPLFTADDGASLIRRRHRAFDRRAIAQVESLASFVELCFARMQDFTQCGVPGQLRDAAASGLRLGTAEDEVSVTASTVMTYTISSVSRSGTTFELSRNARGKATHLCTPARTGLCRANGSW